MSRIDVSQDIDFDGPRIERDRHRPTVGPFKDGRTKSEFAKECDVNYLFERFRRTGISPVDASKKLIYADLSVLPQSYHESLMLISSVQGKFMGLSAKERQSYNNDPAEYLAALENDKKLLDLANSELSDAQKSVSRQEFLERVTKSKGGKNETPPVPSEEK